MVIEAGQEIPQFFSWILQASLFWLLVVALVAAALIGLALLFSIVNRGPRAGYRTVAQRLHEGTQDVLATSPLRILALANLAVKEAVRKKVFVALVLFVVSIAFATWFMNPGTGVEPAKLYVNFVLGWAVLVPLVVVAIFLASFSLPGEIVNRTIYTVVTKPVRPTEIVLGKILGFTAILSVMLLVMSVVGYFFIHRSLHHTHRVETETLHRVKASDAQGADLVVLKGRTDMAQGHFHRVDINTVEGLGFTDEVHQHSHTISEVTPRRANVKIESDAEEAGGRNVAALVRVRSPNHALTDGQVVRIKDQDGGSDVWVVRTDGEHHFTLAESDSRSLQTVGTRHRRFPQSLVGGTWSLVEYEVAAPRGYLTARVAHFANANRVLDNNLREMEGIITGDEWEYRTGIQGGSGMSMEYDFSGVSRSMADPNGNLRLQLTLGIERTIKGDIEKGVQGVVEVLRPDGGLAYTPIPFEGREFLVNEISLPASAKGRKKDEKQGMTEEVDVSLFDDNPLVQGGRLKIRVRCVDTHQYYKLAKHDAYILASSANPAFNFAKGCLTIWFQLVLVTSIGVFFSTFLNGFVALFSTVMLVGAGFLVPLIREVSDKETPGGAAFESLVRVVSRSAMTTDLDPNSMLTPVIVFLDSGVRGVMYLLLQILPDFSRLSSVDYVTQGYSIPWNNLFVQFFILLGFLIPLCLVAHYVVKGREIAA